MIPSSIGSLVNIMYIQMHGNKLTGNDFISIFDLRLF